MTRPIVAGERAYLENFTCDAETRRRLRIMAREGNKSAFIRRLINRAWDTYQAGQEPQENEEAAK